MTMNTPSILIPGLLLCAGLVMTSLTACDTARPTDQQVQQQAADATVAAKQGAREAVKAAQVAAKEAERDLNNVAAGVKQGIHQDAPLVNLNHASQVRLATLPGISLVKAGEIVDSRPYASSHQLVSKGVLTQAEYARIASKVTVKSE